jgi:hypothetical protein
MELPINLDDHFVGNIFISATVLIAKDRCWSKHERLEVLSLSMRAKSLATLNKCIWKPKNAK